MWHDPVTVVIAAWCGLRLVNKLKNLFKRKKREKELTYDEANAIVKGMFKTVDSHPTRSPIMLIIEDDEKQGRR